MAIIVECTRTCECVLNEDDVIETPVGLAKFAGEIIGRNDGRTILATLIPGGQWRVFQERDCKFVRKGSY